MADNESAKPDKYGARLTQAVEQLRANVRWTLVAFGAIGTTLLAGSQLSNLGRFRYDDPRLWLALCCALLALGAAAFAVQSALKVSFSGYTELNNLEQGDLDYVQRNRALLEGFANVEALKTAYDECIETRHGNLFGGAEKETLEADKATFLYLDGLVDNVLSYVRYNRIRTEVERSRIQLTWTSVVAAAGLVGFAWAANPAREQPAIVVQSPASLAMLTLSDFGKNQLMPVLGANCTALPSIKVILLSVATSNSEVVTLKSEECPLARFTVTGEMGSLTRSRT